MAIGYINSQISPRLQGLFLLLVLSLATMQGRTAGMGEAETSFRLGQQNYNMGNFAAAIEAFSTAVKLVPDSSSYHHWLGKSYGRLAEKSNVFRAYSLAGKTRDELERAVALDDKNIGATEDLMEYYLEAPAFLGGDKDKADKLRRHLEELQREKDIPPEHQADVNNDEGR